VEGGLARMEHSKYTSSPSLMSSGSKAVPYFSVASGLSADKSLQKLREELSYGHKKYSMAV